MRTRRKRYSAEFKGEDHVAESGPSFQRFSLVLMSALPPEADIPLESVQRAANDPKRTFGDIP